MTRLLLIAVTCCLALPALAGRDDASADALPTAPPVHEAEVRMAEYRRLQHKITLLSQKNQWPGVERAYQELLDTGVLPEFDDYLAGAHSARANGDVTSTHRRLQRCNRIREDREVIDWLTNIDDNYGVISLKGDPGKVDLTAAQMPFDPVMAKSITFAQEQIALTGAFDGYLPKGDYTFGPFAVEVRPHVSGETIDMRTDDFLRALEKAQAKAAKKAAKEARDSK